MATSTNFTPIKTKISNLLYFLCLWGLLIWTIIVTILLWTFRSDILLSSFCTWFCSFWSSLGSRNNICNFLINYMNQGKLWRELKKDLLREVTHRHLWLFILRLIIIVFIRITFFWTLISLFWWLSPLSCGGNTFSCYLLQENFTLS